MNSDPSQKDEGHSIALPGPVINPAFNRQLDRLVALGKRGQSTDSPLFNPSEQWLIENIRVFQDLSAEEREGLMKEVATVVQEGEEANAEGKAASKVWPETVVRLDNGGLAFFSQLGVARRPDPDAVFHRRLLAKPGCARLYGREPGVVHGRAGDHHRRDGPAL